MGVDVVEEDAVDRLLGPNKKHAQRTTQSAGAADVKSLPGEERPAWDDTPIDMEACIDSQATARYVISLAYVAWSPCSCASRINFRGSVLLAVLKLR